MSQSGVTPDATTPVAPSSSRWWLKWLLIGSLALNALALGVVVRSVWHIRSAANLSGAGLETGLPMFVNSLPSARRDVLRREGLAERPRVLRPLRLELRRARADATKAFLADPFDAPAFAKAQANVLEAEINLRRSVQQMLPEIASRLTVDERRAFLRWRWPDGRGGRDRGPRGGGKEQDHTDEPDRQRKP